MQCAVCGGTLRRGWRQSIVGPVHAKCSDSALWSWLGGTRRQAAPVAPRPPDVMPRPANLGPCPRCGYPIGAEVSKSTVGWVHPTCMIQGEWERYGTNRDLRTVAIVVGLFFTMLVGCVVCANKLAPKPKPSSEVAAPATASAAPIVIRKPGAAPVATAPAAKVKPPK